MSLRDRLTNPKDIERYDRNYNSMEVYITQGELDKEYIHIPKNATNGDMIKAVFPDIEIADSPCLDKVYTGIMFGKYIGVNIDCMRDWWSAPYKRGETDGNS